MKNSKIFFGVSAFALAIAGAFASKATNKVVSISAYSLSANGQTCAQRWTVDCVTTPLPTACVRNGATLYTRITTGTGQNQTFSCVTKLFTTN